MTEPHQPDSEAWHESAIDVVAYNEGALEELAWAIEASVGQFKLLLARCNYTSLRSRLAKRLRELTSVDIRILELKESEKTLFSRIQAELDPEQPDVLMVFGLESLADLDQLLTATNQVREEFRKNFHFPLVLWVNDEVLTKLLQLATDFESWAITTEFIVATDELVDFLKKTAEQFFEGNLTLTLEACGEIQGACHELQRRDQGLDIELKAVRESLLGFIEYSNSLNKNLDKALEHYQKGLELWKQSNNLERQGKLLYYITLGYYLKALGYREIEHPDWQATRRYLRQCIDVFEAAQRPDLVANSLLSFGRILQQLKDWELLQTLAQKALQRHQTENKTRELAQDYGFLAEVALAKKSWTEAKDLAENALNVLATVTSSQGSKSSEVVDEQLEQSVLSYALSQYRFILAKSQQHLDQPQEAIRNLEVAREVGSPEYDTQLYLDILTHLQRLYFEQKEYLKAFEIKLEQQSSEQQYGLRAFVGAGRIQPQRQAKLALTQVESQETIAPEIAASGRLLDVERLIERIGRNDCKLIVIHGQSGVGKSSLVYGGLVPALKEKAIGTSDVLPVAMRVYTNWVQELGRLLAEGLAQKGSLTSPPTPLLEGEGSLTSPPTPLLEGEGSLTSPPTPLLEGEGSLTPPFPSREGGLGGLGLGGLGLEATILEQLKQTEQNNWRTVLIFDQFEEFFFVYPDPAERRQFFRFVGECLNILSVKVILSLREDYLHYLLECDRLDSMKIIGSDILTKNIRYPLGNFSPEDAQAVIERLTERTSFQLESALISQLVRDLAGELGEVRPIELQVVGAQLQTDKITTLARYQEFGTKEELVKRYLDEVVSDCGVENQQAADLLLYLLTDEKGTRPLKTRAELERDLQPYLAVMMPPSDLDPPKSPSFLTSPLTKGGLGGWGTLTEFSPLVKAGAKVRSWGGSPGLNTSPRGDRVLPETDYLEASRLDLVLQIFVKSGLVLLLPENPDKRYQLVHDYLAAFIRQQQEPRLKQLIAELDRERQQRKKVEAEHQLTEEELQRVEQARQKLNRQVRRAMAGLMLTGVIVVSLGVLATRTVVNAKSQLRVVQKNADAADEKAKAADTKAKEAQAQYQEANSQVIEAKGQVQEANSQFAAAQNQYKDAQTNLKDATAKTQQAEKNQKEAEVRKKAAEQQAQQAKQQMQAANQNLTEAKAKVAQAQQQFDQANQAAETANREAQQARQQQQQLQQQVQVAQNTLQQAETAQQQAQAELQQAQAAREDAQAGTRLEREGTNSLKQFEFQPIEALVSAMSAGQDLQKRVKNRPLKDYPATSPLLALQTILDNIKERNQLKGHQGPVISANFSPNGERIVTASVDKTARVWDLNGNLITELKGHQLAVNSANFSPNGERIVTASWDKTAKVWDLNGNLITELKGHQGYVTSANFSPNGERIVTASYDKTARVWDLNGNLITELKGHQLAVNSANFSPNGERIVTASSDKTARVWDLNGNLITELKGHQGLVNSASFSPNGERIVTASLDGTAKVWDLNGNLITKLKGHQDNVTSANFSPNGERIVTASWDGTAKVWDLNGNVVAELKGYQGWVNSASFSPDGERIVTASQDGTAKVWDLNGNVVTELKGHQSAFNSASFSPDGDRIVTTSDSNTAKVWDLKGNVVAELIGHQDAVSSASFSPDGQRIVTASYDKTAKVWDLNGNVVVELIGHQGALSRASFSPDGQRIVTASYDKTAKVWDLNGNVVSELIGHQGALSRASFSPDGERIVTASLDKTARVWDLNGNVVSELIGHQGPVISASFSPDKQRLVTASYDKTAKVWDLNGNVVSELIGHLDSVISASFSPDGQRIVTASHDGTAKVWDLNGNVIAELIGHQREVYSANFSPNGERIVTASQDGTAKVWRVDKNLEQLLTRGCAWLNDYLIFHPTDLEKLEVCQNSSNLKLAALSLVREGEEQARSGNIDTAIATFRKALEWNPQLNFNPEAKAQQLAKASE